jgi:thiol-disulfide isomerase/thioredoxin
MLLLLAAALVYYNVIDKMPETPDIGTSQQPSANVGGSVGDMCYEYDLTVYGSEEKVNVTNYRGKVTIVNFWYIYCGSCVKELQTEFPRIKEEYGDQVEILAVHSYEEYNSDIPAFIADSFPGADFTFCRDTEGEAYFHMLGGSQAWPVTVVLDENGIIVSNIMGSTTYEELKTIIDSALND